MGQSIVGNKQAVVVSVCVCVIISFIDHLIGVDRSGIGKGHPIERLIRKAIVLRARNALPRQVKPIGFAGGEGVKVNCGECPLRGQSGNSSGNLSCRRIQPPIASEPPKISGPVSGRAGQALAAGGNEAVVGLDYDIHGPLGGADFSAV